MTVAAPGAWQADVDSGVAQRRYRDRELQCEAIKVLPGEYHVTGEDIALITVLGSCVSACIRDPRLGVGGMNHFMLPEGEAGTGNVATARYGAFAMELLLNELFKRGARRQQLEAKVFGGGNVLRGMSIANVGSRNAEFVLRYLDAERIAVVAQDLGGPHARKLGYFPCSGRVLLKHVPMTQTARDLAAESEYGRRISQAPQAGDVELF